MALNSSRRCQHARPSTQECSEKILRLKQLDVRKQGTEETDLHETSSSSPPAAPLPLGSGPSLRHSERPRLRPSDSLVWPVAFGIDGLFPHELTGAFL